METINKWKDQVEDKLQQERPSHKTIDQLKTDLISAKQ